MDEPKNAGKGKGEVEKLKEEVRELEHEVKEERREAEGLEREADRTEARLEKLEEKLEELEDKHDIEVIFNEKYLVTVKGHKQTGASLKVAAIAQGVPIQPDFVLSIELGHGKTELIGDTQHVKVKKGDRFLAIPNDDNS